MSVEKYIDAVIVFAITLIVSGVGVVIYRMISKKRVESEKERAKEIFSQFFNESSEFVEMLFDEFFENLEVLKIKGEMVSILFKIPCKAVFEGAETKAYYLYGVVTHKNFQGRGYIKELMNNSLKENALYIVKPISDTIFDFYSKMGFSSATAYKEKECKIKIEVTETQKKLSLMRGVTPDSYNIMYKWDAEISEISFSCPLS